MISFKYVFFPYIYFFSILRLGGSGRIGDECRLQSVNSTYVISIKIYYLLYFQRLIEMRVGIFGGGVVGGGVYEIIQKCMKNGKFPGIGANIEISKICVRSLSKPRDYTVGSECKFVTDYNDILGDSSIDCIVEVMGGVTHAKDVVFEAIKAGKHVITANKALVATCLPEISSLLDANPKVKFAYEAAVCGGIPIIHALQSDFLGDDITRVCGIMNGTTNFMLCKMEDEGAAYAAVLKEAQDLGFAEADPTADVEGLDVQAKIALLTNLAYGRVVPTETIPTAGISSVASIDFEYAKMLKSTIKLVGCAATDPKTSSLAVYVSPMIVPLNSPLASAKGPGNMVLINSYNNTQSILAGPGAGRYPTANSVVNDLLRLSLDQVPKAFPLSNDITLDNNYDGEFYVRVNCADRLGIIKQVGQAAEGAGVSIHAVLQNPIESYDNFNFVVTTETCKLSEVQAFAQALEGCEFTLASPMVMPLMK